MNTTENSTGTPTTPTPAPTPAAAPTPTPAPVPEPPLPSGARRGKIARLPKALRHELNLRLQDGEQSKLLVEWLNTLPTVTEIIKTQFHGIPLRENNISEWRKGGYLVWQQTEELRAALLAAEEDMGDLQKISPEGLSHRLAFVLAAQLALQIQRVTALPDDDAKIKALCALTESLVKLRRGDLQKERLEFQREKDKMKKMTYEEKVAEFWKWAD